MLDTIVSSISHIGFLHRWQIDSFSFLGYVLITLTTAHPGFKRQFEILATPDVKAAVVRADPLEEGSVDREEAAGHRRRPNGFGRVLVPLLLPLRYRVPIELVCKS